MRKRPRLFLIGFAAIVFAGGFQIDLGAQNRDRFSHAEKAHQKTDCNSCHKVPTPNWVAARGYPDVADFPGHNACFACHRGDIFGGKRLSFCGGCHVTVAPAPRGTARFPFPVRSRSQEFSTTFPHNLHQDVVASNIRKPEVAVAHFVNAGFVRTLDDPPRFNNCAICHETSATLPKFRPRALPDLQPLSALVTDIFSPGDTITPPFFKDSPDTHASCFTCHYQGVQPVATDCKGCHSLTAAYFESNLVQRYSLRFNHNEIQVKENEVDGKITKVESFPHARDCMTCHVRIAQNADIKTLVNADVPYMACSSCHEPHLNEELDERFKQPTSQCNYCHTSAIGRFPVPPSHK